MPKHDLTDLARLLLERAEEDRAAAAALAEEQVADRAVGLHAQQAVEKALKAVIAVQRTRFPYVHDLGELADRVEQLGIELPLPVARISALTPYAAELRYGAYPFDLAPLDRRATVELVDAVVAWARDQLA